jgi:CRP-like cAMP-binding protein
VTKQAALSNGILRRLPRKEFKAIFPKLELVPLHLHSVLNEAAKPITYCYFVLSGLASILTVLASGKIVEVGLTGAEGFVGLPLVAGLKSSAGRIIVQVTGSAFRIRAKDMIVVLADCPALRKSLGQFGQEVAVQSAQIAACNRLHNANQRMARWLLAADEPGPVGRHPSPPHSGIPRPHARNAPGECDRRPGFSAKSGAHYLRPRCGQH